MMEQKPFFSIVMPVYGVAHYLEKAIESIVNQTFRDFELILVDDCSIDGSLTICELYANKYKNIYCIHHNENKGVSIARNTGLDVAKGKYIWFPDSDDFYELDLLEQVYHTLKGVEADLVVFGAIEEYYNIDNSIHHTYEVRPSKICCLNQKEVRKQIINLEKSNLYGYPWNKIYKIENIKNNALYFEKITLIEDILFNVQYCNDIHTMIILDICPYHYAKRNTNSLTAKYVPEYYQLHKKRIKLLVEQFEYWSILTDEVKGVLAALYARYIFSALQRNCDKRSKMTIRSQVDWCRELFQDKLFNLLIPYGRTEGKLLSVLLFLLKKRMAYIAVIVAHLINCVINKMPMLFYVIKQKR